MVCAKNRGTVLVRRQIHINPMVMLAWIDSDLCRHFEILDFNEWTGNKRCIFYIP